MNHGVSAAQKHFGRKIQHVQIFTRIQEPSRTDKESVFHVLHSASWRLGAPPGSQCGVVRDTTRPSSACLCPAPPRVTLKCPELTPIQTEVQRIVSLKLPNFRPEVRRFSLTNDDLLRSPSQNTLRHAEALWSVMTLGRTQEVSPSL